jgi:hypothetical protein
VRAWFPIKDKESAEEQAERRKARMEEIERAIQNPLLTTLKALWKIAIPF